MKIGRRKVVVLNAEGNVLSVRSSLEFRAEQLAEKLANEVPGSTWSQDADGDWIIRRPLELGLGKEGA